MLRVSRSLFIAVISASLVCSPLFALRAGASHNSRGDKPVSAPPLNT